MFSQYFKLNSLVLILALVLAPIYPAQVMAEEEANETPSELSEEIIIEEPTPEESGSTEINTGDAAAETEINNDVNIKVIETETIPAEVPVEAPTLEEVGVPTPPVELPEDVGQESSESAPPSLDVLVENEAVVENESETAAETGENSALAEEEAIIDTGNASASANVVSVVNLNLIESNGFLYLLNNFLQFLGHIDLRPLAVPASDTPAPSDPCEPTDCDAATTSLAVEAKNEARISNAVIVRSQTGGNSAQGDEGASIDTGNAYAGANVVNIANTNIIDSNYLLFAFNNFGGWDGDLIFPNADFFSSFFLPSSMAGADVSNTNSANIENTVETSADTGSNESEGDGSLIETGEAVAGSNVTNIVNTNLVNAPTFFVVFRIFGAWNGSVFNAPEGISWAETPSGIELFSTSEDVGIGGSMGMINVETENTADITNNVQVFALTGENKATSADGGASVDTGNAYAGANVLNVANTNVISSNWIVALINIFGDWNGNVSFGQPDLWVATQVETPGTLSPGSEATFHTTIANRGDASASNVLFNGSFNSPFMNFKDKNYGEAYSLEVGNLAPGETKEFSYSAKVNADLPYGDTLIDHALEVSANETDGNPDDNFDAASLFAWRPLPSRNTPRRNVSNTTIQPALQVSKTNSAPTPVAAPGTVDYTIVVENKGGSAFEGVLYDVLKDENNNIITENNWELGEIFPDEEITITYTAVFNASTVSGVYTNSAWVEAWGGDYSRDPDLGTNADSEMATSLVTVLGSEGKVLGESCGLYLDKFIRQGMRNDPEQVKKLQEFLNKEMDASLPVTGFYGPLTFQATKVFQEKYADEILTPWSLGNSTGIVYQTTLRWINQLECPQASIEMPSLIAWTKNPNVPIRLATIAPDSTPNPVSPTIKPENDAETNEIINQTEKTDRLAPSTPSRPPWSFRSFLSKLVSTQLLGASFYSK